MSRRVGGDEAAYQQVSRDDPSQGPDQQLIRLALTELPAEQRVVIELAYYEGLSSSEIAVRESMPIGTVKSRTAAALATLRSGLGGQRRRCG